MKIYRHNGERWYIDDRSILRRLAHWFCRAPLGLAGPVWFLGARVTYHGWGVNLRASEGIWVLVWPHGHFPGWKLYRSANGTPGAADTWLIGAPPEVVGAVVPK